MTLPIAEHGDVVTCTNGHRVGVAERFEKRLGIAEDFAVILDDPIASTCQCPACGARWWRPRRPTAELHVEGRGWVRTSDDGGAA